MKRLLIVSPGFAPANTPDSHRARLSLPHWRALGWEAEVLAVRGADVEAPQEPELLESIPVDVPVHRVRAWPTRLSRMMGIGSLSWRSRGALRRAGSRLLAAGRFDLVFISTSQFGVFSLGPHWKRTVGVPYVLDFQDPWVTDYYDRPGAPRAPGGWKYRLARRQARLAEPFCLREAAGVVSVSPDYPAAFASRYPWFDRRRACELPFPAADTDFALLAATPSSRQPRLRSGSRHLVAVGAVTPSMRRSLAGLFRALASAARERPAQTIPLLHFVGTAYVPGSEGLVLPLAREAGVGDLVEEHPARIAYLDALRWMQAGDALLALGSDDAGYVPSRLANLLWLNKPVLTVADRASALARRIQEWARLSAFAPEDQAGMAAWLGDLAEGRRAAVPQLVDDWRELHCSGGMTRRLAEHFEYCDRLGRC